MFSRLFNATIALPAAARAGIEYGTYDVLRNTNCTGANVALGGTLSGFVASVTCTPANPVPNEAGTPINSHTITSNACNQPTGGVCPNPVPGANYVERQMTVMVER